MSGLSRVHDRELLDALERIGETPFTGTVWRTCRKGRSALVGSSSAGRWSAAGECEVLYTSLEREGSLAEIGFRLSLEPVWPSRMEHEISAIAATAERCLRLVSVADLIPLGVDPARWEGFDYAKTQAISSAAHFLEYDGLLVPSARHPSLNLVIFMDRPAAPTLEVMSCEPVDWAAWRTMRNPRTRTT